MGRRIVYTYFKASIVAYFKLLSWSLSLEIDENHVKPPSEKPVTQPRLEPVISQAKYNSRTPAYSSPVDVQGSRKSYKILNVFTFVHNFNWQNFLFGFLLLE
jgi:hypothetical protein